MPKLRASGGYRQLKSFQSATIIYDGPYWFCERFFESRSRMCDQMVQAARSGRQNIAEGSRAGAVSSQTELRLTNVARASLEELLLDYEDFLRHRHLTQWSPDSAEAKAVREVARQWTDRTDWADRTDEKNPSDQSNNKNPSGQSYPSYKNPSHPSNQSTLRPLEYAAYTQWLDHSNPAIRANALICLIHQTNYLLDRQIQKLEADFVNDGGYSEQLATARVAQRSQQKQRNSAPSDNDSEIPDCPICGTTMVLRTARQGKESGKQFFGCSAYPTCKGIVNF